MSILVVYLLSYGIQAELRRNYDQGLEIWCTIDAMVRIVCKVSFEVSEIVFWFVGQ